MTRIIPILVSIPFLGFLASCQEIPKDSPGLGPSPSVALKTTQLKDDANQRLQTLLSETGPDNALFSHYHRGGKSTWSKTWTRRFDFSGVCWSLRQAGTAITPRHVVAAGHFGYGKNNTLVFHDRDGNAHRRRPTRRINLRKNPPESRSDILVVLLDKPLPDSVKTYRLLPPREDYTHTLPGCPVLVTEQSRHAYIHKIRAVNRAISFSRNDNFPSSLYKNLIGGDSGHPSFLVVGGEPVLIETHTGGGPGSGPFYSHPAIFAALEKAVAELDPSYHIQTVPLDHTLAPPPPKKKNTPARRPATSPHTPPSNSDRTPRVRRVPVPKPATE